LKLSCIIEGKALAEAERDLPESQLFGTRDRAKLELAKTSAA